MNKAALYGFVAISLSLLVTGIQAAHPGPYVGMGVGVSRLDTTSPYGGYDEATHNQGGLGGRVFLGYHPSRHFGLEMGYARYARSRYQVDLDVLSSSIRYEMKAVDWVGKGYMPLFDSSWNLYVLGGIAYVEDKVTFHPGDVPLASGVTPPPNGSTTYRHVRPLYGVGVEYDVPNSPITTSMEFSRIQGTGNRLMQPSAVPFANMLTVNLAYTLG